MNQGTAQYEYTARQIADEIARLSGREYDPGYISNVRSGSRSSRVVRGAIDQAIASLLSRGGCQ